VTTAANCWTGETCAKLWRLLACVAVFAVVGPPVGGLVAWVAMGARTLRSPLPFLGGAYGEGFVLAIAAGALVGLAALWLGTTSWIVPVVVAVMVNVVMLAANAVVAQVEPDLVTGSLRIAGVFFPPSLIAALACWWLTRPLLRPAFSQRT
jgi:hypothetical protein